MEAGEVSAEGEGKYQLGTCGIAKAEVDRLRKLRQIILAQRLMAKTIKEAMEAGEVSAERNGKGTPKYLLCNLHNSIDAAEVDRWRKLRQIPMSQFKAYFAESSNPSRAGVSGAVQA